MCYGQLNSANNPQGLARVQVVTADQDHSARKAVKTGKPDKAKVATKASKRPKADKLAGQPKGPMPNPFEICPETLDSKTGRPSSFSPETASKVLQLLVSGQPMTPAKLRENGLPSPATIYRWTEENETFLHQYTRARQFQAHVYADQTIELSDTAEDAGIAKLQIDTRKWYASKIIPKLYGDKQLVDVTTDIGATAARVLMDLTQQAREAKAIEHNVIDVTPTLIGERSSKDNNEIE